MRMQKNGMRGHNEQRDSEFDASRKRRENRMGIHSRDAVSVEGGIEQYTESREYAERERE